MLLVFFSHCRVTQIERFELFYNHVGDNRAGEPFIVGGNDVPRRPFGTGVIKGTLKSVHVVVPLAPFSHVGKRKFPVLLRCIDTSEQAALLLSLREVEEEFQDDDSIPDKVLLKVVYLVEAMLPDTLSLVFWRQHLQIQNLLVDSDDQHFFVVGAIKNSNPAARR